MSLRHPVGLALAGLAGCDETLWRSRFRTIGNGLALWPGSAWLYGRVGLGCGGLGLLADEFGTRREGLAFRGWPDGMIVTEGFGFRLGLCRDLLGSRSHTT